MPLSWDGIRHRAVQFAHNWSGTRSEILDRLGIDARLRNVIEMACGYGTFTVPVARISGSVTTYEMVAYGKSAVR